MTELPDLPEGVSLELDEQGRPVGIELTPQWERQVGRGGLAATVTSLLVLHGAQLASPTPLTPHQRSLADSDVPMTAVHALQQQTAALQSEAVALLSDLLEAKPDQVSSRNGRVVATVWSRRVVAIQIDPDWVETATAISISETVSDVFQRAAEMPPSPEIAKLGELQRRFDDITNELNDYRKG